MKRATTEQLNHLFGVKESKNPVCAKINELEARAHDDLRKATLKVTKAIRKDYTAVEAAEQIRKAYRMVYGAIVKIDHGPDCTCV